MRFHRLKTISRSVRGKFKERKFVLRLIYILLGLIVAGSIGIVILFAWYAKDLPTPTNVVRREGYSSQILDRNGQVLYDVFKGEKRSPATWDQIPDSLKKATIAVEDKDFYKHNGFDPMAPLRIIKNFFVMGKITGGSTLTQQLVKNVLLTSDRTVTRKIKELILAIQIEAKYKKDEILLMYLNEAPYGGTAWGVEIGAKQYFGKSVKDLSLVESIILAGIPQSPNNYSPYSKTPTAYIARADHVLTRMIEDGYVPANQKNQLMDQIKNYKFSGNKTAIQAPHFVFWVRDMLIEKYGEAAVEGDGLKITTTLDLDLQTQAEKIMSEEVDKAERLGISNGASIVIDPTNGQVLSMVGSRDYFTDKTDGKFNVVTQGLRQPGSSIKPVTYLAAIKKGWTSSSLIMDTPVTFQGLQGQKDYSPQNYTGKYNGPMSLKTALGNSINTTAVKMLANVGLQNMLQLAYDMGLPTLQPTKENLSKYGLAVTLGGAEVKMIDLASAYCAFANGGQKIEPIGILKVEDRNGRVLEEYKPQTGKQVMTPQEAFIVSNMLYDNTARQITFGPINGLIVPNYQVAVKTGTTNDLRDNWAIGWTPNLLVATWVGNNDNSPMGHIASGVSGATPIWKRLMTYGVSKRPKQDFPIPEKVISLEVDKISGYPAHDGFPTKTEYFIDGTQPKTADPIHLNLKVCKGSSGLATPEDVANNNYDTKEYFSFKENDVISQDGRNRWQEGIDQWIALQPDKDKYNPPTGFCRTGGMLTAGFGSPNDKTTVGNDFDVRIDTNSLVKVTEIKLSVNGTDKMTWNDKPFETRLHLDDGVYTLHIKVTDKNNNSVDREIKIGVNKPWDWAPAAVTPTTAPVATPTVGVGTT